MNYPADQAISAAFEQILDQLDNARRLADPKDKNDLAYWRNQHNAFSKAHLHFEEGVRPRWTGFSYLVKSATRPDSVVHRVRRAGGVWLCSCEATSYCWHAALVGAVDQAQDTLAHITAATAAALIDDLYGVAI
jgi:hypothetical protein